MSRIFCLEEHRLPRLPVVSLVVPRELIADSLNTDASSRDPVCISTDQRSEARMLFQVSLQVVESQDYIFPRDSLPDHLRKTPKPRRATAFFRPPREARVDARRHEVSVGEPLARYVPIDQRPD
jgi:hypothetical protein